MLSSKYIMYIVIIVTLIVLVVFKLSHKKASTGYENITAKQALKLYSEHQADPNFAIIDIRTSAEYDRGHIPGSININFLTQDAFENSIAQLDKNKKYLVYCQSGNRSGKSMPFFEKHEFKDITNMSDGISKWQGALTK